MNHESAAPAGPDVITPLGHEVFQIDTRMAGYDGITAGYLIRSDRPCLVETGTAPSAPVVREALASLGVGAADLATVVVTHIHLDHAGGVGDIAEIYPNAEVVVHERGARHLADPSRLMASARMVYGDELDELFGELAPTPAERIRAVEQTGVVDLGGGRRLESHYSPGHAKHHIAVLDDASGVLLVGDAAGVKVPGGGPLRPATPPDDFDLELAVASLHKMAELRPTQLVLTHFGPAGDPQEVLAEAEATVRSWCEVAEEAYRERPELDHIERALLERVYRTSEDPSRQPVVDALNGVASNAAGIFGWLRRREASSGA